MERAPLRPPSRVFDNHGYPPSIGSGSITVVTMTDDDKKAASKRERHPVGFVPPTEPPQAPERCAATCAPSPDDPGPYQCFLDDDGHMAHLAHTKHGKWTWPA